MENRNGNLIAERKFVDKDKFELANKWIRLLNKKVSILKSLRDNGITEIILYGVSEFALRLMEQCENENHIVKIIGISDKRISSKGGYYKDIPFLSLNDVKEYKKDNVCIVITAMGFYEEIRREFQEKGIKNYVSLKDLIHTVYC